MSLLRPALPAILGLMLVAAPAEAAVRNYFSPEQDGNRIAACLTANSDCGKPAADAFCRAQGYDKSVLFQRESHAFTRSIATGETCEGAACTAFRQVKCFSAKDDLASIQ